MESKKTSQARVRRMASGKKPALPDDGAAGLRRKLERAADSAEQQRYLLRLYVTGTTPASLRAIERVREFCEERLSGRFELEVIDIYQLPALAKDEQIIAAPTLIRVLPEPLRRFIGDLSKIERVLFGIDLRARP